MARNIIVKALPHWPIEQHEIEMCEHKGIGHPDTMTDAVSEAASRELSLAYLETYGHVLHHNLDKGLLVAGKSVPCFGGGKLVSPIKIIIGGRATSLDAKVDVHKIAVEAAQRYLKKNIRCDLKNFEIVTEIKEGSGNLKEVFARRGMMALANDTSFGVGYAPYSLLEKTVLATSRMFKSPEFKRLFPAAGDDFKIMGHRVNGTIKLTIALAFIDRYVEGVEHYFAIKKAIYEYMTDNLEVPVLMRINTLDNPIAKSEDDLYLTVSGLSAEMGDDGQVGRGNRANELITPSRGMSLEATAGKNPVAHVGKIYNVLAMIMARDIYEKIDEVDEVSVKLLSAIGDPIDEPQIAAVEVSSRFGVTDKLRKKITAMADEWLENIDKVTQMILKEKVTLY